MPDSAWIPITERLPEKGRFVLFTWQPKYRNDRQQKTEVGVVANVGEICSDERDELCIYSQHYQGAYGLPGKACYSGPTHWQPLPDGMPPLNDCEAPRLRNPRWDAAMKQAYPSNMAGLRLLPPVPDD